MHELEAAPNRVRFDELNSVRADQALCNDGIMPLFCPTGQMTRDVIRNLPTVGSPLIFADLGKRYRKQAAVSAIAHISADRPHHHPACIALGILPDESDDFAPA